MTPEDILNNINECKEYFYSRVKMAHVINYTNGFVGAGVFINSQDHLIPGANTIWIFSCGFNHDGSEIEEQTNVELTLDEAEDMHRALGVCIEKFKNEERNLKIHQYDLKYFI